MSDISKFIHLYGDGIKNIGFQVDDVEHYFAAALKNGASEVTKPTIFTKNNEHITTASVSAFGRVTHKEYRPA